LRKIPVKALPDNMPQEIVLNIGKLNIGDKIKASQVKSDKYEILLNENTVLVMILKARGLDVVADGDETEESVEAHSAETKSSGEE
jgi:large subunit ribosomal protein L25